MVYFSKGKGGSSGMTRVPLRREGCVAFISSVKMDRAVMEEELLPLLREAGAEFTVKKDSSSKLKTDKAQILGWDKTGKERDQK